MASILPGLRKATPRLSRDFFICHQCLKQPRPTLRQTKFPAKSISSRSIRFNSHTATITESANGVSPLSSLAESLSKSSQAINKESSRSRFPETSSKSVGYWLLGSAASVFGIVVFGGLTRLTESGYVRSDEDSFVCFVQSSGLPIPSFRASC